MGLQESELPIDYLDRREALFQAVTLADMKRVARRLYRPDQLTVVVVGMPDGVTATDPLPRIPGVPASANAPGDAPGGRSEEHTSELQSLMRISYAVFCLKKKKTTKT